jgi:WD40 repeat protein
VLSVAFSPDNPRRRGEARRSLIATGSADGKARLWDAVSGDLLKEWKHETGQAGSDDVRMVSFSPDGKRLLTVGGNRFARVFDVARRQQVLQFNNVNQVFAARYSYDGRLVATVGANPTIRVWDSGSDAAPRAELTSPGIARIADVQFSPDGRLVASASMNDTVAQIWDLKRETIDTTVQEHLSGVESIVFHPIYALIATIGRDGIAYIARSSTRVHAALLGHRGPLNDGVFSPSGREFLTASDDGTARVWNARVDLTGPLPLADQHQIANLGAPVNTVALSPDGKFSLAAAADGTARLYSRNKPGATLRHGDAVTAAEFSRDSRRVLTASADGTARMWRTADGAPLATFTHGAPVNAADLSRDGRYVVTAGSDKSAWLWDAKSGKRLRRFAQGSEVMDARFSPDGNRVVTGGADGAAAIWRVATGAKIRALDVLVDKDGNPVRDKDGNLVHGHSDGLVAAAFSPSGRWVATASLDSTARIWNLETGTSRLLEGHEQRINAIAFSHDGKWLATASNDADARIWSIRTGRQVALLQIHVSGVRAVEFSADDRWVATAGPTAVGIWQTRERGGWRQKPLYLVREPPPALRPVTDVAFSPRGWKIVFGSADGSFRTFNCTLCGGRKQLSAIARARLHSIVMVKRQP